jgi:hypothetical protein
MDDEITERFKKHDSRNGAVFDEFRVIGHVNCRHLPRCISMANVKSATGPKTHPSTPVMKVSLPGTSDQQG